MEKRVKRVLSGLYKNMRLAYSDYCHGVNHSDYDELMRESLKKAESLGLRWRDFYEVCEEEFEKRRQKCISELRKDALEVRLIEEGGSEKMYLLSFRKRVELDPDISLRDFYKGEKNRIISEIKEKKVVRGFSEDKKISSNDFYQAYGYFSESFRG